jgi:hypothetical protein
MFYLGFGMHPFADLHRRSGRNPSQSRRAPQQMTLFDNFFSPMRMSVFDQDSFAGDFGGNNMGTISSFNISFGFVDFGQISNFSLRFSFLEATVVLDHYRKKRLNLQKWLMADV